MAQAGTNYEEKKLELENLVEGVRIRRLHKCTTINFLTRCPYDQGKEDTRVTFEQFLPMLQSVSSRPITDTVDDFVEGLRHFDKVSRVIRHFDQVSRVLRNFYNGSRVLCPFDKVSRGLRNFYNEIRALRRFER